MHQIDPNLTYESLAARPPGPGKAIEYIVCGLLTDGDHHKQWCLERALEALGMGVEEAKRQLDDCYFEPGIAP